MRFSATALLVALSSTSVTAFVPWTSKRVVSLEKKPSFLPQQRRVARHWMEPPAHSSSHVPVEKLMEAKQCLEEIRQAADKAREYVAFLNQVAKVVRQYIEDQKQQQAAAVSIEEQAEAAAEAAATTTVEEQLSHTPLVQTTGGKIPPRRASPEMPHLENLEGATKYLENIEKATGAAQDYLNYLEEMAEGIRDFLLQFDSTEEAQEAQTYLNDLEETAEAAKDYLAYLKTVAQAVQKFLVDPDAAGDDVKKLLQTDLTQELHRLRATQSMKQVDIIKPTVRVQPPPAPALEVDWSPTESTKRIVPLVAEGVTAKYMGSFPENEKKVSSNVMDDLSSIASQVASTDFVAKQKESSGGGYSSYLDSMGADVETPTHHFKGMADSTPYSETGPPAKGRSDVSHMDKMADGSYLDQLGGGSTSATTPSGSGMPSYFDTMAQESSAPVDWSSAAGSAAPESTSATTTSQPDTLADKERQPEQDISPKVRVLGAKYMEQLQEAAQDNPVALKDEFDKRQREREFGESLEETALAAKEYLNSLKDFSNLVQHEYLVDPNLRGIEEYLETSLPQEALVQ